MADGQSDLVTLKEPLAIRPDFITSCPTTLRVKQSSSWSNGDYTALNADGSLILSCDGKVWSNSARKEFNDASGLPLFSLRASWFSMSKAWRLELPGDGHMILAVRPRWSLGKVKLDCTFKNAASASAGQRQEDTMLEVRGQDTQHLITHINREDDRVAIVRRVSARGGQGGGLMFMREYEVDVAEGMDMALVGGPCQLERGATVLIGNSI